MLELTDQERQQADEHKAQLEAGTLDFRALPPEPPEADPPPEAPDALTREGLIRGLIRAHGRREARVLFLLGTSLYEYRAKPAFMLEHMLAEFEAREEASRRVVATLRAELARRADLAARGEAEQVEG